MNQEFLMNMLDTISVSGYEEPMQDVVREEMQPVADQILEDDMSNLICVMNPEHETRIMLSAHGDEIGLIVSNVTGEGKLQVIARGGIIPHTYPGQHVCIQTEKGRVYGVMEVTRAMLKKEDLSPRDFLVDIGVDTREEALELVQPGDPVSPDVTVRELANGRITGKALDDKLGVYIIMEAFKRAREKGCQVGVYGAVTTGEETTKTGAYWCSQRIRPTLALVVDVTFATDCLGGAPGETGEVLLGKGPVLCNAPLIRKALNKSLEKCAEKAGIPLQKEVASRITCTDGDQIHFSNDGVPIALISIPLRYMHSPSEVADKKDIEACIQLIATFLAEYE